jgi:hypothetical protein
MLVKRPGYGIVIPYPTGSQSSRYMQNFAPKKMAETFVMTGCQRLLNIAEGPDSSVTSGTGMIRMLDVAL